MDSGVLFHTLYETIINSQRHKKENTHRYSLQSSASILLIYRDFLLAAYQKDVR